MLDEKTKQKKPQDFRLKEETMKALLSKARNLTDKPMFLPDES